jgi:RNA polymerase sigma-70 factor (ECF subfamily)
VAEFPETNWSQLLALGDGENPRRRQLLARLAESYWAPIYHYVRALRRISTEDAQDHTQQFFAHLLEGERLQRLSPARGSFRGFLKISLRNFLIDADRSVNLQAARLDVLYQEAEAAWLERPTLTPDQAFDRAWNRAVLSEAIERLRAELRADGRDTQVAIFDTYCLAESDLTYDELGAQQGLSGVEVKNRLYETRRRLRQIVRALLRDYLSADEDVETELASILTG